MSKLNTSKSKTFTRMILKKFLPHINVCFIHMKKFCACSINHFQILYFVCIVKKYYPERMTLKKNKLEIQEIQAIFEDKNYNSKN